MFSGRIVGYSIDSRRKSRLTVMVLQFRSRKFVSTLARHGLVGLMGRAGAAGDNAGMESFLALLQRTFWIAKSGAADRSCGSRS